MMLANPAWLWALSALIIPLAIHMLSRKEGRVLRVGSLRFLHDSPTRQFKSIRLNELLLLLLRILMLLLLVAFLARLMFPETRPQKWLLTEDKIVDHPLARPLIDSLLASGYEWRDFKRDFPIHGTVRSGDEAISYWSLAEALKGRNLENAVIVTAGNISNFIGTRPTLTDGIRWITIPQDPLRFLLSAQRLSTDSVSMKTGLTSVHSTIISKESRFAPGIHYLKINDDSVRISEIDTLTVCIAADPGFEADLRLVKAALQAISTDGTPLLIKNYKAGEDSDWLIWLSEKPQPPLSKNEFRIFYQKEESTELFIRQNSHTWSLTTRLGEDLCLEKHFTTQLLSILAPPSTEDQMIARNNDRRQMPEPMTWSQDITLASANAHSMRDADNYLIFVLLLTWIAERWIAYRRNQ